MEKWREVYSEEQLKKVQELELKNLLVLKSVCSELGISFFAYGGTLIGAVRHKGFVPWDDDLDVAMLREDYDKFVSKAPLILPEEYELQTPYHSSKTPYPYTKLRLKGTKYIEYGHHKLNIEQGIYVDIYPIDNLPDDDKLYLKQFSKYQKWTRLYAWRQCPYMSTDQTSLALILKKAAKRLISCGLKLIPQKYMIARIRKIATQYNGTPTKRKGNLNFPRPVNVFYHLLPLVPGEFEGISILLPGDWDQHLSSRYGDYMKLPPEEERLGHKPYLLDFGKY